MTGMKKIGKNYSEIHDCDHWKCKKDHLISRPLQKGEEHFVFGADPVGVRAPTKSYANDNASA